MQNQRCLHVVQLVAVFHMADVHPHEHASKKAPDSAALRMGTHFLP